MNKKSILGIVKKIVGVKNFRRIFSNYTMNKIKNSSPDLYYRIQENNNFKDSHKGERCFILGNGPSLRNVNFSDLSEEFVFSCNFFNLINGYEKAEPDIHLVIDPDAFDLRSDLKTDHDYNMKCFEDLSKLTKKPLLILPSFSYEWVLNNKINNLLDTYYICISQNAMDGDISEIDLTKATYYFETVIEYAIEVAIYMGFKEIYLLGCEGTVFLSCCDMILNGEISPQNAHAYDKNIDNIEDAARQILNTWQTHDLMYSNYKLFFQYKRLRDYCDNHDIIIRNCTNKSIITEIEKQDLNSVLNNGGYVNA